MQLSGDDFGRPAPPIVWRAETGFFHHPETSAADVIRYEQEALGRAFGIGPALMAALAEYPASALLWVTASRADALRYAPPADVAELRLDIPAVVIATDDDGGLLLFFPDDVTQPTGGAAMADRFENDPAADVRAEIKAEIYMEAGFSPAAAAAAARNAAEIVAVTLAPPRAVDDEDEQKKHGRGGGMENPADANLGANIRPEVGSGPGGLETYTTQKSADYRADPEQKISDYFRERLAETARRAETPEPQPMLTLEAIAADPWNAVILPLPPNVYGDKDLLTNGDKELLTAARSAAEYCAAGHYELMEKARAGDYTPPGWTGAAGEADVHESDEANFLLAADRLDVIDEALAWMKARGPAPAARQENDANTKRQETERAARSGEAVSPDAEASVSDYFKSRLSEAKAARDTESVELAAEHAIDKTPGGGGRGMF